MICLLIDGYKVSAFGDVSSLASTLNVEPISLLKEGETELTFEKCNLPTNTVLISEEQWRQSDYTARIVDGNLIFGKPEDQIIEEQEEAIRNERYLRLRVCDKISPMRWNSMTEEQQLAWTNYRQALLDIPQQEGFPWDGDESKVPWPTKPE